MSQVDRNSDLSHSDSESTTSTLTTSGLIPGVPRFFGCYLLVSESPDLKSKNRTYIGFTVNPVRRLRQHNGDLARGGAARTKRHRPWRMVAVIHGFECKAQALSFEWAWTNPGRAKCLSDKRGTRFGKTPRGQLSALGALGRARPWKTCPLTLTVTVDRIAWDNLHAGEVFPDTLKVDFRAHGAFGDLARYDFRVGSGALPPTAAAGRTCTLCLADVGFDSVQAKSQCANCERVCCLQCFAECAMDDEEGAIDRLVPQTVFCPACKTTMPWALVVRLSRALGAEATIRGEGANEDTSRPVRGAGSDSD